MSCLSEIASRSPVGKVLLLENNLGNHERLMPLLLSTYSSVSLFEFNLISFTKKVADC